MPELKCDLIVNAGGASRRMGAGQGTLWCRRRGRRCCATSLNVFPGLFPDRLRHHQRSSVGVKGRTAVACAGQIPDDYPGAGALGGLATGLARCSGWAIAVACDMPLVDPRLFAALAALTARKTNRYGTPSFQVSGSRPQPLTRSITGVVCPPSKTCYSVAGGVSWSFTTQLLCAMWTKRGCVNRSGLALLSQRQYPGRLAKGVGVVTEGLIINEATRRARPLGRPQRAAAPRPTNSVIF